MADNHGAEGHRRFDRATAIDFPPYVVACGSGHLDIKGRPMWFDQVCPWPDGLRLEFSQTHMKMLRAQKKFTFDDYRLHLDEIRSK